jgi:hypothetical protein
MLHLIEMGFTTWETLTAWKFAGVVARTNSTSGYNRSIPNNYVRQVRAGSNTAAVLADWASLFAFQASTSGYASGIYYSPNDSTQAHLALTNNTLGTVQYLQVQGLHYISMTNAALNLGARQSRPGASASKTWLNAEMSGKIPSMRWSMS